MTWIDTENNVAVDANEITSIHPVPVGFDGEETLFEIQLVTRGQSRPIAYNMVLAHFTSDPPVREAMDAAKAAVAAAKCHCRH